MMVMYTYLDTLHVHVKFYLLKNVIEAQFHIHVCKTHTRHIDNIYAHTHTLKKGPLFNVCETELLM